MANRSTQTSEAWNGELIEDAAETLSAPLHLFSLKCDLRLKHPALVERDLLITRRLSELERSHLKKSDADFKSLPEQNRFLLTSYSLENLIELAKTLKESLLGPLGDYYLEKRRDFLNDIC